MNERIRQLAEQAGFDDRGSNHTAYMNFDHEKFAELIVNECAEIADTERPNSLGCGYITKTKGRLICEHFGIE
jgi:hypothetical protein